VLRHRPAAIALSLGIGGWVRLEDLLVRMADARRPLTRDELEAIIHRGGKRRFALSADVR
jgi:RNA:NAD 2'-phosphotransferase (TPT1/KptA family)